MKSFTAIGALLLLPFLTIFTMLYFATHRIKWLAPKSLFEPARSMPEAKNACIG